MPTRHPATPRSWRSWTPRGSPASKVSSSWSVELNVAALEDHSVTNLRRVYEACAAAPGFEKDLARLLALPACERAATWLLKHHLEGGHELAATTIAAVYARADALTHWEAQLHLLQCMPFMPVPEQHLARVEAFLRCSLAAENKFVRAWAYNGFWSFAMQVPAYREEAKALVRHAARREAPSVRARARQLAKQSFPPLAR